MPGEAARMFFISPLFMNHSHAGSGPMSMKKMPGDTIQIEVSAGASDFFTALSGYGFIFDAPYGTSIKAFLEMVPGIDADYIENNIGTILQNGKPVDDPDTCKVTPDAAIALSGALPGLFGAAFRKKGCFAALRPQGDHENNDLDNENGNVTLTLKLFNLTAKALGPALLKKGAHMSADNFRSFWKNRLRLGKETPVTVLLNEKPVDPVSLEKSIHSEKIFLIVKTI